MNTKEAVAKRILQLCEEKNIAINALANAGIEVVGGASGNVREVAEAFVNGTLQIRSDFHCNHHHDHGEDHNCGSHSCGSHNCGNH